VTASAAGRPTDRVGVHHDETEIDADEDSPALTRP
jgi:hypothetical protein